MSPLPIRGFNMTPLYDILSAQPLIDEDTFHPQKIKLAMAFGDNRHYKIQEIHKRHFLQAAKSSRLSADQAEEIIQEVLTNVDKVINRVSSTLYSDFPKAVADSIFSGMKKRAKIFR